MSENPAVKKFQPSISLATPLQDYKMLMKEKMESEEPIDDEELQENYAKIAGKMRETIWQLLFSEEAPKPEDLSKAAKCLREHKSDACFHAPWEYNEWIPKVRDELLKRGMLDFWRNVVVKKELGPCWARDSDYFDNMDDPEPAKFYEYAGCKAPFRKLSDAANVVSQTAAAEATANAALDLYTPPLRDTQKHSAVKVPEKISMDTPLKDYKRKLEHQIDINIDDQAALNRIFGEVRAVIWALLFEAETLSPTNYEKAAETLGTYKLNACFFNPWDYNDWIKLVRDELFKRKYFDFWKNVIVEKKLGLCWYKDSDYFDDSDDPEPPKFYRSGDELMKKYFEGSKSVELPRFCQSAAELMEKHDQ